MLIRPTLTILLLALLTSGCEDRETGLVLLGMMPRDVEGDCNFPVQQDLFLGRGVVDLSLRRNYVVAPLIENRLLDPRRINEFEDTDARLDPNDIILQAATVEYTALDQLTANLPGALTVPISTTVVNEGGQVAAAIEVLTPAMTDALRQSEEFLVLNSFNEFVPVIDREITIIVRIRVRGETLDGREVESNEFLFPLNLCLGCQVSFPPELVATNCEALPAEFEPETLTCTNAIGTESVFVNCLDCLTRATRIYGDVGLAREVCVPNP